MKPGKSKKNSSVPLPAEKPPSAEKKTQKITLKKKPAPVSAIVVKTRKTVRRVEPLPQPITTKLKRRAGGPKGKRGKKISVEPTPQPRMVVRERSKDVGASSKAMREPVFAVDEPLKREVAVTQQVSRVAEAPVARVKSASSRRTPKAGVKVEPVMEKAPVVEPVLAPVVRPSVGGPIVVSTPKQRFVREPRPVPVEIPPILLEPDYVPTEPAIAGPGARFALTPPMEHARGGAPKDLPESYGTEQIFLAARDPYCLFASWDLDAKQRARYNTASASGAVTIRLRRGFADGPIELEAHTLPTSRDQFIEVKRPDTTFVAELGYHEKNSGTWRRISVSKSATTPRDRMAPVIAPQVGPEVEGHLAPPSGPEQERAFETPRHVSPSPVFESQPRKEEIIFATMEPWVGKHEPLREKPHWQSPPEQPRWKPSPSPAPIKWKPKSVPTPKWSAAKTRALDELISLEFRRMQQGSLEIEEVLRRRILRAVEQEEAPSSIELAEEWEAEELVAEALGLAQAAPSSLELAERPGAARKGFWFKVNAELIIYGSTEPDAHVSIGGRAIRLRADGSFSYRFALPDGAYELPVVAIAQDRHDERAAELRFSRATQYSGEVGAHPQDTALKSPSPANL